MAEAYQSVVIENKRQPDDLNGDSNRMSITSDSHNEGENITISAGKLVKTIDWCSHFSSGELYIITSNPMGPEETEEEVTGTNPDVPTQEEVDSEADKADDVDEEETE